MTYRFRAYPSRTQSGRLTAWQHTLRSLWNAATSQRLTRLRRDFGPWPTYNRQAAELTDLRRHCEWHKDVPTDFSQSLLRVVDSAWQDFFAKKKRLPRFKSKDLDWACMRTAAPKRFRVARTRVKLPKLGWVKIRAHRKIIGVPKVISLTKDCEHWFVSITCEITEPEPAHPHASKSVGLDAGVKLAVADSDGKRIRNPQYLKRSLKKLARAQRQLARKRKGSHRREKAKLRVAHLYQKIRRQRRHWQHQISSDYTKSHGIIVIEALKLKNMMRSAKGTAQKPGRNVKAKSGLNRSLSDVGWGEICRQLTYKSNWRGAVLLPVNPRNTSRRCRMCGHTCKENRRKRSLFLCVRCSHKEHADIHAAKNILALSQSQSPVETAGAARGGSRVSGPMKRERLHCAIESSVL